VPGLKARPPALLSHLLSPSLNGKSAIV
jgi:hypothetical protein